MDKEAIIKEIKRKKSIGIADLQLKFNLSYKEAKQFIDELAAENVIKFDSGVKYKCVQKTFEAPMRRVASDAPENSRVKFSDIKDVLDVPDSFDRNGIKKDMPREERKTRLMSIEEILERRKIKEDKKTASGKPEEKEIETIDEELEYRVLKFLINKKSFMLSNLQQALHVSFICGIKLIHWMEEKKYVSKGMGNTSRDVLITPRKFKKLYKNTLYYFIDYESEILDGLSAIPHWNDTDEFEKAVAERIEHIVKSKKTSGKRSAVAKAEKCLKEAKRIQNSDMIRLYERVIFEIKMLKPDAFDSFKKRLV